MQKIEIKKLKGVTLIELMMTICIVAVVMFGVAALMASDIGGWKTMYDRLNSESAKNSYEIRRMFDRVVRQASIRDEVAVTDTTFQIVYYDYVWNTADVIPSAVVKARATFTYSNGKMTVVSKKASNGEVIGSLTISNVANKPPFFKLYGRSVQMMLTINNVSNYQATEPFSEQIYVCSTAYLNSW